MARNEAAIVPVNCIRVHRRFYARYDVAYDGGWVLTYGLKDVPTDGKSLPESSESLSKIDVSHASLGPQYKCPYCGNKAFVRCGICNKLTCYSGQGDFTCGHCGNTGKVSGYIDSLNSSRRRSQ